MSSNYNYISVSSNAELMTAFTKVMSESTNQEIKFRMAKASLSPYWEIANTMRQICNSNTEVYNLVNNLIRETRTQESLERQKRRQEYV